MNEVIFVVVVSIAWGLFIWYVSRIKDEDKR